MITKSIKGGDVEGQWLGKTESGDTDGNLIIDIDEYADHFGGTARLFVNGEPSIICEFHTIDRGNSHKIDSVVLAWMPEGEPIILTRNQVVERYPEFNFPSTAIISLFRRGNNLTAKWVTDIGTKGRAVLRKSEAAFPSNIQSIEDVRDWKSFKNFAVQQKPGKFIFRGQPEAFRAENIVS